MRGLFISHMLLIKAGRGVGRGPLLCLSSPWDLVLSTVPDTQETSHKCLINDEGTAVFAVLPIVIARLDSLIMRGAETIVFIPADSDNSQLPLQQSNELSEHLMLLDFVHTLLGRPRGIPFGFRSG